MTKQQSQKFEIAPPESPETEPLSGLSKSFEERVDDLLTSVNGSGSRFQQIGFVAVAGGINSLNLMFFNMAYMELIPRFKCMFGGSTEEAVCVEADFCGNENVVHRIDWDSPMSLVNWSQRISLVCRPGWQIGLLGSAFYFSWACCVLWVPSYADKFGRVRLFKFGLTLSTVLFGVIIVSNQFLVTLVSLALLGALASLRSGVGWPYLLETVPKKDKPVHSVLFNAHGALQGIFGSIFFAFVNQNAYYFLGIGFAMELCSLYLTFTLPESPVYLLNRGLIKEAEEAL